MFWNVKKKSEEDPTRVELSDIEKEYTKDVRVVVWGPRIVNGLFWIWGGIDVLLIGAGVVAVGLYLANGAFVDKRLTARFAQNTVVQREASIEGSAVSLVLLDDPRVISLGGGKYDIVSMVENPNAQWVAYVEYAFELNGEMTETVRAMIPPESEIPLVALGVELEGGSGVARVDFKEIDWVRPRIEVIDETVSGQSVQEFYLERSDVVVTNAVHGRASSGPVAEGSGLAPSQTAVLTTAELTNQSPYSYWDATFVIVIERAGTPIAVNTTTLKGFESGETRDVVVRWFGSVPTDGDVVFYPTYDVFDKTVYMEIDDTVKATPDINERPL